MMEKYHIPEKTTIKQLLNLL